MTVKERMILRIAEEYAGRLGVGLPDIVTQRSRSLTNKGWTPYDERHYGVCYASFGDNSSMNVISINRHGSLSQIKHTIAHELIHYVFSNLSHGHKFDRYVHALQRGYLFFRGAYRNGKKITILDTK